MSKEFSYGVVPYLIINGSYFLLLNKTSKSSYYNFFKGKTEPNESKEDTAIREFLEETGVLIDKENLEDYVEQKNKRKDIGIFLLDFSKYNNKIFKFDEKEIYSATWVNINNYIEVSKNQKEILLGVKKLFTPKIIKLEKIYNYTS